VIPRGSHDFPEQAREVTKTKLAHIPAGLADDVVMVILQLAQLVPGARSVNDLEKNTGGFKKIERTIDRCQSDAFPALQESLVNFPRTQGSRSFRKYLIHEEPGKAKTNPLRSEQVLQKSF